MDDKEKSREEFREKFYSRDFARSIIIDGRIDDTDIMEGWHLTREEIDEIVMQRALDVRKLMQELRLLLFRLRESDVSLSERRCHFVRIICLLHQVLDGDDIRPVEFDEVVARVGYYDARNIRLTLLPMYPECEDYVLMYHGRQVLDSLRSEMLVARYIKEKSEKNAESEEDTDAERD